MMILKQLTISLKYGIYNPKIGSLINEYIFFALPMRGNIHSYRTLFGINLNKWFICAAKRPAIK